mgnify:CR=1 FL=1
MSKSTCSLSDPSAEQKRALPSSLQLTPSAARILARSMQELVQCSLDVSPVVLKSFDGTLPVAAGELESGDFGIAEGDLRVLTARDHAHDRIIERLPRAAVEDVAVERAPVFEADGAVGAARQFLTFRDNRHQATGDIPGDNSGEKGRIPAVVTPITPAPPGSGLDQRIADRRSALVPVAKLLK